MSMFAYYRTSRSFHFPFFPFWAVCSLSGTQPEIWSVSWHRDYLRDIGLACRCLLFLSIPNPSPPAARPSPAGHGGFKLRGPACPGPLSVAHHGGAAQRDLAGVYRCPPWFSFLASTGLSSTRRLCRAAGCPGSTEGRQRRSSGCVRVPLGESPSLRQRPPLPVSECQCHWQRARREDFGGDARDRRVHWSSASYDEQTRADWPAAEGVGRSRSMAGS
jgi:hypothetical protein